MADSQRSVNGFSLKFLRPICLQILCVTHHLSVDSCQSDGFRLHAVCRTPLLSHESSTSSTMVQHLKDATVKLPG